MTILLQCTKLLLKENDSANPGLHRIMRLGNSIFPPQIYLYVCLVIYSAGFMKSEIKFIGEQF